VASTQTDTRSRILDTAWTLIRRRGPGQVTVADIAEAAGVSRQLVYVHFANRAGLLVAVARHHDASSGFVERVAATRKLPPVEGLEALLRLWFAYIPDILPFGMALEAAATSGEEGAAARHDRMGDLREAFRIAVDRVHRGGWLADRWTVRTATDWVWARSHLTIWQLLVGERGWRPGDYTERAVRSILAEVVENASPAAPTPP
jgi:AcrR family transcriptional regulator